MDDSVVGGCCCGCCDWDDAEEREGRWVAGMVQSKTA